MIHHPHTDTESQDLLIQFQQVRTYTTDLCRPLSPEDYIPQPVAFISPPKWHLGHTTWFFEELILKPNIPDYQAYHEDFSFLFNSYYNSLGKRILRTNRGNLTRPSVKEVYAYRAYVDEQLEALIEAGSYSPQLRELIILGLNHEQQHQELLVTDLKYILGHNPLFPAYHQALSTSQNSKEHRGLVHINEGIYEIGFEGEGFHYDNELGRHKVYLHPFEIQRSLVTNGEFLAFMEDGGYERFELWLDEGWSWVKEEAIRSPFYWHQYEGEWHHYTLGGFQAINPDSILCHISYYEAAAFAEWKGMRLPTEFEWEAAADQLDWGARWEWTNSAYLPYPYFTTAEGAVGEYNGKFMVNQKVLRGASVATSPNHSRKTYRNFFHAPLRWQFTGIRLAKSL
ncbi:MAG: ergothioneine biosynthesis protein EgtB [Bacteroidota bacterium]